MKISEFDKEIPSDGAWIPVDADCELFIAPMGNPDFQNEMERAQKPYIDLIRRGSFSPKLAEELARKVTAKTILLGWRGRNGNGGTGLQNDDGSDYEYTEENAVKLLEKESFAGLVLGLAESRKNEIIGIVEDGTKN